MSAVRLRVVTACLVLLTATWVGITPAGAAAKGTAVKPDPNATLTVAIGSNTILAMDPQKQLQSGSFYGLGTASYDRLVQLSSDSSTLVPMLAESWSWDSTGTVLTFRLRKDVKFQDGNPFTADVAVQNIKRSVEPGSNAVTLLKNMTGVTAVDPATLRVTFAAPDPSVIYVFAGVAEMMVSPSGLANPALMKTQSMGSGAFKIVGVDTDATYHMQRFDGYWDKSHVYPAKIEVVAITDQNTRLNAIRTGNVDESYVSATSYPTAKADKSLIVAEYKAFTPWFIYMNNKLAPFDKPEVRKAVGLAVNRAALNASQNNLCTPIGQTFPQGVQGHVASLKPKENLNEAKKLMTSAGVTSANVKMIQILSDPYPTMAKVLQAQLAQIGLNVELVPLDSAVARPTFRQGSTHLFAGPVTATSPDPAAILDSAFLGNDNAGNIDPKLADMTAKARTQPIGSKERDAQFQEINRYLADNVVNVPLCQYINTVVAKSRVIGADKMPNTAISVGNDFHFLQIAKAK